MTTLFVVYLAALGSGFHFHVCPDGGPVEAAAHLTDAPVPLTETALSQEHHDVDLSPASQWETSGKALTDQLLVTLFVLAVLLARTSCLRPTGQSTAHPCDVPHLRPPLRAPPL